MECLINRIGIKGCDAPFTTAVTADPEAIPPVVAVEGLPILLINSLPGVTLEKIDSLVNDEQETFLGLWNDIVLRTIKKFEVLVKSKINQCYKITDKTIISCLVCEKKELFDVALWYLHGAELMIEITSTDVMNRYTTIDIMKAEKLKEDYYTEFIAALNDAVDSLNPDDSDCITGCLECNDSIKFVTQLP